MMNWEYFYMLALAELSLACSNQLIQSLNFLSLTGYLLSSSLFIAGGIVYERENEK
jgi:hypothetical protein